jgi:hypothetical protein
MLSKHPADAMSPEIVALEKRPRSNQTLTQGTYLQDVFIGLSRIQSTIGLSGIVVLSSGILVTLICTVWAIVAGVPHALAIMAGYCTLVGSVCLCAALLIIQNLSGKKNQTSTKPQPNYTAWSLVTKLRVSDASRLWCEIEPGCPASQECIAWAQAILDAIRRGELPVCERAGINRPRAEQERANPGWHTEIEREALKVWAQSHGHAPTFLRN